MNMRRIAERREPIAIIVPISVVLSITLMFCELEIVSTIISAMINLIRLICFPNKLTVFL
jgi:hypothetical protein